MADGTGAITGKVTDAAGTPLSYANILITGTNWGCFSAADGSFRIDALPPGTYTLQVTMLGFEERRLEGIEVPSGGSAGVVVKLETAAARKLPEVVVTAAKNQLEKSPEIKHVIDGEDAKRLPIMENKDAIATKPSVFLQNGQMHFRGGRASEIATFIDGVPVRDPLQGQEVSLSVRSVETTETILGGLDARYGNAQSGVINYTTKEGRDEFEGEIYYLTDDYGQPDNTFDNLDRIFLGAGGPAPLAHLTWYLSGEGTYQDDYPGTARRRNHHRILNFISVGDRKTNSVRLQGKLAFRPASDDKLTFEFLDTRSRSDPYLHVWSRPGYVQTFFDTTKTGEVHLRHGRWSPSPVDSTYSYYNAAEHTPTQVEKVRQAQLAYTHTIDSGTWYSLRVNRNYFYTDSRVQGKEPWEYSGDNRDFFFNYADRTSDPFFAISGDYPSSSHRETVVYDGKADLTRRMGPHTLQSGLDLSYNDMRYLQVDDPSYTNELGQIGRRTRYHFYNPEAGAYLQDVWAHEGMSVSLGLRYDLFSVGRQIDVSEVKDRVKTQVSPRLGMAYPISDRDVFSFFYGRYYQIPERRYIFENRNLLDGRARGNPNLTNETTVTYQAGIQHMFNELVSAQFGVYYRDMFGLVDTEQRPVLGNVETVTYYVNRAYASARGFEASLSRRFKDGVAFDANYTFGVATGVASDPNGQVEQAFVYFPVSEQPLRWDVRHSLNATLTLADRNWSSTFSWQYHSGVPYTPRGRNTREQLPQVMNSRRLPGTTELSIQAEKLYRVWGQDFKLFLQAMNVLDARNITWLSPDNFPHAPGRTVDDYITYYTETGKAGGAYIGEDTNGDGVGEWVPLNDPRVYGDPRRVRVGMSYSF